MCSLISLTFQQLNTFRVSADFRITVLCCMLYSIMINLLFHPLFFLLFIVATQSVILGKYLCNESKKGERVGKRSVYITIIYSKV